MWTCCKKIFQGVLLALSAARAFFYKRVTGEVFYQKSKDNIEKQNTQLFVMSHKFEFVWSTWKGSCYLEFCSSKHVTVCQNRVENKTVFIFLFLKQ